MEPRTYPTEPTSRDPHPRDMMPREPYLMEPRTYPTEPTLREPHPREPYPMEPRTSLYCRLGGGMGAGMEEDGFVVGDDVWVGWEEDM